VVVFDEIYLPGMLSRRLLKASRRTLIGSLIFFCKKTFFSTAEFGFSSTEVDKSLLLPIQSTRLFVFSDGGPFPPPPKRGGAVSVR
jgi:hypothetical protein